MEEEGLEEGNVGWKPLLVFSRVEYAGLRNAQLVLIKNTVMALIYIFVLSVYKTLIFLLSKH